MQAPDFWANDGILSRLLAPFGWIYGIGAMARRRCTTPYRAERPIVCVGNFIAGGAGKTPVALAIADWYLAKGLSPHFLTRGYGGRLAGPLQVDLQTHSPEDVGDEALLLARKAPTWVSRTRAAGAKAAVAAGAEIIIMDDGFQNPGLYKDLSVVVVDGGYGIGNGRVMPSGPLREFLNAGLSRADAIVILGKRGDRVFAELTRNMLVIKAALTPVPDFGNLDNNRAVAFAGIGRPQKFFDTLSDMGFEITATKSFPDHHVYSASEISELKSLAARTGASLVTTEKDYVRLDAKLAEDIRSVPVKVKWSNGMIVDGILSSVIAHG